MITMDERGMRQGLPEMDALKAALAQFDRQQSRLSPPVALLLRAGMMCWPGSACRANPISGW